MITFLPLYIDPGTGSMLFSVFIAVAAALSFLLRAVFLKAKFLFSGGKARTNADNTIPFVIFSDHKRYWNIFEPVCDEFEKRQIPLVFYTASPDDPALSKKYEFVKTEFIGEGNKAFAKLNFLHADVLLSTTPGLDVYQWKRSKYVKWYVHVPHTVDDLSGYRMFGLDFYDAVLATGENQKNFVKKIEAMRQNIRRKEIVTVGYTYLDSMMNKKEKIVSEKNDERINVLVAPTWGDSGMLTRFGKTFLVKVAETGFDITIRPHPQSTVSEKDLLDRLQNELSGYKNVSWNYDTDNFTALAKSDILITDFSGITFDYAFIFDRPVIYADTNFDSSPYDAAWLTANGDTRWTIKILPKVGIKLEEENFADIKNIIEHALKSETLREGRNIARDESWQCRGESAKKITDYAVAKQKELTAGIEEKSA